VRGVPANRGRHGIEPEIVLTELAAAGFRLVHDDRDWLGDGFGLVFEKRAQAPEDVRPRRYTENSMRFAWLWLVLFVSASLAAQTLPSTEAETLTGRKLDFPKALAGQPVVCVFSFSKEAGEKTNEWMKPLLAAGINAYSVAHLEGAPRLVRGLIRGGMRKSMPANQHDRSLILTRDEKAWRAALEVKDDRQPIAVKLDATGRIVARRAGPFDPRFVAELK
jgi:hypothetical protein